MRLGDLDELKKNGTVIAIVNGEKMKVVPVKCIDNAPTISPCVGMECGYEDQCPNIPHGEWITTRTMIHNGNPYCSICDEENIIRSKFCPNCGARMGGQS